MKITKINKIILEIFCCYLLGIIAACTDPTPYNDPHKDGYNVKNDQRPWYDPKAYPFYEDMFNGKSIKPQEVGTYQKFPKGSVPVGFTLGKIEKIYEPILPLIEREIKPRNPTQPTEESIVSGRLLFNTYCKVCHGKDGNTSTPVVQKAAGRLAIPPIAELIAVFSEAHLYNKIRYGSFYSTETYQPIPGFMPPYGMQTSRMDRWDMVNYMKSPQFGKEE